MKIEHYDPDHYDKPGATGKGWNGESKVGVNLSANEARIVAEVVRTVQDLNVAIERVYLYDPCPDCGGDVMQCRFYLGGVVPPPFSDKVIELAVRDRLATASLSLRGVEVEDYRVVMCY